jgi:hypothetical protein
MTTTPPIPIPKYTVKVAMSYVEGCSICIGNALETVRSGLHDGSVTSMVLGLGKEHNHVVEKAQEDAAAQLPAPPESTTPPTPSLFADKAALHIPRSDTNGFDSGHYAAER